MIEHKFSYESLMGGWYISENICDDLILFYEKNKDKAKSGKVVDGDTEICDNMRMSLSTSNPDISFKNYVEELQKVLDLYNQKYIETQNFPTYQIEDFTKIQKYEPSQGYKVWHYENDGFENKNRFLVFMTYLNNVHDGGTQFKYQNITLPAKKGLTLIWPAFWTHTHRGQVSHTKEKYIITGWFSFNE